MEFSACNYRSSEEVGELVAKLNKDTENFDRLLIESCLSKDICWEYEKEWRIIKFASIDDLKYKNTSRGIIEYVELEIPIDLVEEICLGPKVEKGISKMSIESLKDKLSKLPNVNAHFEIRESSIKIR